MQAIHTARELLPTAVLTAELEATEEPIQPEQIGAFFEARISEQARFKALANELELLRARLDAHGKAVVELFCLLVENSPEVLPPEWAAVADVIAAEERLWVYPKATVAQIEEEPPEAFMPFLNRKRLAEEWPRLLEHARRVYECQQSGARFGYQS
ncbi:MAG: hypothetical protein ACK53K_07915 [Burkholderiales bacterium]